MHDFVETGNVAGGKDVRLRRLQAVVDADRFLFRGRHSGLLQTKPLECRLATQCIENFVSIGNLLFAVQFVPDTFPGTGSFDTRQLGSADHFDTSLPER